MCCPCSVPHHSTAYLSTPLPKPHRYALNVWFNLLNKSIFKYFPFPYTVSTVHVIVGTAYCALVYVLGLKSWSFGRVSPCQIDGEKQRRATHTRQRKPIPDTASLFTHVTQRNTHDM